MATFRPKKVPYFVMFGLGVSCGLALVEANENLRQKLDKSASNQLSVEAEI